MKKKALGILGAVVTAAIGALLATHAKAQTEACRYDPEPEEEPEKTTESETEDKTESETETK